MKILHCYFFFFSSRRRHTRWTGDWSSDVCSSDLTLFPDEKPVAPHSRGKRDKPPDQPHQQISFRRDLFSLAECHLYPGKDQQPAENVDHPVKPFDQPDSDQDKDRSHCQGAEYPPFEDLRLVHLGDVK